MALKWIEGYETDRTLTYLQRKYASATGGASATGRLHGFSSTFGSQLARTPSLGLADTWVIGIALRFASGASHDYNVIVYRGAVEQIRLHFEDVTSTTIKCEIKRGATILATVSNIAGNNIWHYFEFKVTVHPTTGSYELRQNEITVASDAGPVNTANGGSAQADVFEWSNSGNSTGNIDDVYVLDGTGGFNDTFRGDSVVEGFGPNADGATLQWTPSTGTTHFNLVDDADTGPSGGEDSDNNSESTVAERDLYEYSDLAVVAGTIHGIMLCPYASLDLAGSRQFKTKFRNGAGTVADFGGNLTVATTTILGFPHVAEKNPISATNWTKSDVDGGQFGVELVS